MAEFILSKQGALRVSWKLWLPLALVVGVLGLGVKVVWFDSPGYLVPTNLVPVGANLATEHYRVVHLNLGQVSSKYLPASQKPRGFALTSFVPGALIPVSGVGANPPETVARVVVSNKTQLGSGVRSGATVAVWSAQRLQGNQFDVPKRLVTHATVSRLIKGSAMFGNQNQQVEILVNPLQTPAILAAMASDSPIFLVAQE